MIQALAAIVDEEQHRITQPKWTPRRIVAINAIHNRFEPLMRAYIEFARSPFSGRLRHGYVVLNSGDTLSWLGQMTLKRAGERAGSAANVKVRARGHVASGPHMSVLPGRYAVAIEVASDKLTAAHWLWIPAGVLVDLVTSLFGSRTLEPQNWNRQGALAVEIRDGKRIVLRKNLSILRILLGRIHKLEFDVGSEGLVEPEPSTISVRLWSGGWVPFTIRRVDVQRLKSA